MSPAKLGWFCVAEALGMDQGLHRTGWLVIYRAPFQDQSGAGGGKAQILVNQQHGSSLVVLSSSVFMQVQQSLPSLDYYTYASIKPSQW